MTSPPPGTAAPGPARCVLGRGAGGAVVLRELAADGSADLAMTIRTIVLDGGGATVGAGGGITVLSDPGAELAESRLKAEALLAALTASAPVP